MLNWLRNRKARPRAELVWQQDRGQAPDDGFYSYGGGSGGIDIRASAVWACISRIAQRAAQARFRVVDADGTELPHHPVSILLRSPSGAVATNTFQSYMAESLLTDGNAYALKLMGQGLGAMYPTALRMVQPHNVSIVAFPDRPINDPRYDYTITLPSVGRGETDASRRVPNTMLVHMRGAFYDPTYGKAKSPLRAACQAVGLYEDSVRSSRAFLTHASRYGGFIETLLPVDEINKNRKKYDAAFASAFGGTKNAGKIARLPFGHKIVAAPSLAKEMLLAEQLNWAVNEIARHWGVPLSMLQQTGGVRMPIEEQEEALIRDAVAPLCAQMSAGYDDRLLMPMDRMAGRRVAADLRMFAMPTASGKVENAMKLAQIGAVSINELRNYLGYAPIEGGDEMPATAGAPERDNEGVESEKEEKADDTESNET